VVRLLLKGGAAGASNLLLRFSRIPPVANTQMDIMLALLNAVKPVATLRLHAVKAAKAGNAGGVKLIVSRMAAAGVSDAWSTILEVVAHKGLTDIVIDLIRRLSDEERYD